MQTPTKAPRKSNKQKTLQSIKSLDPEDDERTTISKKISWILRHGTVKNYIEISDHDGEKGWVKMSDLLKAEILNDVSAEQVNRVIIDSNAKKLRYKLSNDGQLIKAYSKEQRKALSSDAPEPKEGASLRPDAEEFVPAHVATPGLLSPSAGGLAQMGGYPWPYLGLPPALMQQYQQYPPFGWPGTGMPMGVPQAPRAPAPPQPAVAAAAVAAAAAQPHLAGGRHQGRIKSFNPDKGFGFIACEAVFRQYNRDAFVHKAQIGDLKAGDEVSFAVETNKQGMPQAKDLARGWSSAPVPATPSGGKGKRKGGGKDDARGKGEGKGGKGEGQGRGGKGDKKKKEANDGDKKEGKAEDKEEVKPEAKVEESSEAKVEEKTEEKGEEKAQEKTEEAAAAPAEAPKGGEAAAEPAEAPKEAEAAA